MEKAGSCFSFFVVNRRVSFSAGYYSASNFFYNSKNLNCIGVLSYDLFTNFHDFWSQIGVVILVTPKQEVERKSEWFYCVIFLAQILMLSEKKVFEQKFAFSLVVFCSHAAISLCFSVYSMK